MSHAIIVDRHLHELHLRFNVSTLIDTLALIYIYI